MPVLDLTTSSLNATSPAIQVICAWPVSGQYGPGSRALYYVLVAACVLARKAEWLRNACLVAALIFPAVAAIHGIVLAALHNNNAVDMDVFGAFQLCSIGILAAPVTVRLSKTYFFNPGRNTIFLWTGLILAGLLSLTVEFFRIKMSACSSDDLGNSLPSSPGKFPYGNATCNLTCSTTDGPFSPLRGGSANNIYVIPAPDKLTFGTATLLAAGCCIPAILSLVSMWNKILEINWTTRFGNVTDEQTDEPMEGTNGATIAKIKDVNSWITVFLNAVEVPLFGAAVLAILVIGERNLLSHQVDYQTEPIASIGQWAPIVGTGLAVLGSMSLLLAARLGRGKDEEDKKGTEMNSQHQSASGHQCHCNCHMGPGNIGVNATPSPSALTSSPTNMNRNLSNSDGSTLNGNAPSSTPTSPVQSDQEKPPGTADGGSRRKVAKVLTTFANYVGTAAQDRFDVSDFKGGKALDFPELPGEAQRNPDLTQIREQYNVLGRSPSRAGSFTSRLSFEGGSTATPRAVSPQPRSASTFPLPPRPQRPHANPLPAEGSSSSAGTTRGRLRLRGNTLEVPSPIHQSSTWHNHSTSSIITVLARQTSPTIVVSSEPDGMSSNHSPVSEQPTCPSSLEERPTLPEETLPPSS